VAAQVVIIQDTDAVSFYESFIPRSFKSPLSFTYVRFIVVSCIDIDKKISIYSAVASS
jgi:hypothetical protein